tara:strand:- start:300 stop:509 length:210 start_codon:yes stop_codon:yes gene_type:complete
MRPAEVLRQLAEMRETYKNQGFSYNKEQRAEYDKLLKLRRERVSMFIKTGRVSKGGLRKKEVEPTTEES